jgi:hypothetical protein
LNFKTVIKPQKTEVKQKKIFRVDMFHKISDFEDYFTIPMKIKYKKIKILNDIYIKLLIHTLFIDNQL